MPLEHQLSQKGKPMLLLDGFLFVKEKSIIGNQVSWKCTNYSTMRCTARMQINQDGVVRCAHEHNHAPNKAKVEANAVLQNIKAKVIEAGVSITIVLSQALQTVNPSIAAQLQTFKNMKCIIQWN